MAEPVPIIPTEEQTTNQNKATFILSKAMHDPKVKRMNCMKPNQDYKEEYHALVTQIKQNITREQFMRILNEPRTEYTKSFKLKKASFRQFIASRYGSVVAEKW